MSSKQSKSSKVSADHFSEDWSIEGIGEEVIGKILNIPAIISGQTQRVRAKIQELMLFHPDGEETKRYSNSKFRKTLRGLEPGTFFVGGTQGGQVCGITFGFSGGPECVRIEQLEGIADKATKIPKNLGWTPEMRETLNGQSIYGKIVWLEDDTPGSDVELFLDDEDKDLVRRIKLMEKKKDR